MKSKSLRTTGIAIAMVLAVGPLRSIAAKPNLQIKKGSGDFLFVDEAGNKDKPIKVWYFRPEKYNASRPIVFAMHGVSRNGDKYRDQWTRYAKKGNFLLLAPEFGKEHYPWGRQYNRGNMFDAKGKPIEKSKWTFMAIEHLFDYVVKITGSRHKKYYVYGHSAGGQFVHRMITFLPEARIYKAVAANPGWYTVPTFEKDFPYGLKESGLTPDQLSKAFSQNLAIMVGSEDTDVNHKHLKKTPQAMEQGKHRLERGRNYFKTARQTAKELGVSLKWRFAIVPGVAHSNSGMSRAAVKVFFPQLHIKPRKKKR